MKARVLYNGKEIFDERLITNMVSDIENRNKGIPESVTFEDNYVYHVTTNTNYLEMLKQKLEID